MGILPEAGYLNETIYDQDDKSDFYVVGAATNVTFYDTLLDFKIINNVSFPLATSGELGYMNMTYFFNNFIFIGKYNKIIGTLSSEASQYDIDTMLKRAMASFHNIYVLKEKDNLLLQSMNIEIDLKDYFYCEDYSKVEFIVKNTTNPYIAETSISGTKLTINKTSVIGSSELSIIAKVPGRDIYALSEIEIINPTTLFEDFEIETLRDSKVPWINSGDAPWSVTEEESFFNSKSIRSGQILPGQTSGIALQLDLYEPGTLIFAYKTSTRDYFDKLHFSIDGLDISEMESYDLWSGVNDWRVITFSVRAGRRNINWEYIKGPYVPSNQDIVWLDMIVVPDKQNTSKPNTSDEFVTGLLSAFPNPFNPVTEISFELIQSEKAELMVFDLKGRLVAEVYRGELEKGVHSFNFDGSGLSSGLYFSVLKYGDKILTNKLILAK
jgi:hypothetical protein